MADQGTVSFTFNNSTVTNCTFISCSKPHEKAKTSGNGNESVSQPAEPAGSVLPVSGGPNMRPQAENASGSESETVSVQAVQEQEVFEESEERECPNIPQAASGSETETVNVNVVQIREVFEESEESECPNIDGGGLGNIAQAASGSETETVNVHVVEVREVFEEPEEWGFDIRRNEDKSESTSESAEVMVVREVETRFEIQCSEGNSLEKASASVLANQEILEKRDQILFHDKVSTETSSKRTTGSNVPCQRSNGSRSSEAAKNLEDIPSSPKSKRQRLSSLQSVEEVEKDVSTRID